MALLSILRLPMKSCELRNAEKNIKNSKCLVKTRKITYYGPKIWKMLNNEEVFQTSQMSHTS